MRSARDGDPAVATRPEPSRRRFLGLAAGGAGALVGASVLAACSGGSDDAAGSSATSQVTGSGEPGPSSSSSTTTVAATTTSEPEVVPGSEWFSVTDFGATPDDAAAGFAAAIEAASDAGGGVVQVPAGTWQLGASGVDLASNVTLRGASILGTVLRGGPGPLLNQVPGVVGTTVESLTLDGAATEASALGAAAMRFEGGAAFCVVRRVRITGAAGSGVLLRGSVERMFFDEVFVESVGGHGFDIDVEAARGLFVSGLSVADFGSAIDEIAYGVRVRGRTHLSELHIEPVRSGQVAVGFLDGSENTTLTNHFIGLDGGVAYEGESRPGVAVGTGSLG